MLIKSVISKLERAGFEVRESGKNGGRFIASKHWETGPYPACGIRFYRNGSDGDDIGGALFPFGPRYDDSPPYPDSIKTAIEWYYRWCQPCRNIPWEVARAAIKSIRCQWTGPTRYDLKRRLLWKGACQDQHLRQIINDLPAMA